MAKNNANAASVKKEKSGGSGSGKVLHGIKEIGRKFIVSLKRRPYNIPFAVFIIAFVIYSFNMTAISDTTALLGGRNMGLAGFVTMLFGILSMLCFMNAFRYRKPVNKVMACLLVVMVAVCIFCDVFYINTCVSIRTNPNANIVISATKNFFILEAEYYLKLHIGFLVAGLVLTALLPVYSKLIRKINTNVEVAGNEDMKAIDLSGD